jgi:serine phosphatase RsbU (regulator of sigma subunit)
MVFKPSLRRPMRLFFALFFFLVLDVTGISAEPVELASDTRTLDMSAMVDYVEDVKGDMALRQLMNQPGGAAWVKNTKDALTFGYTDSVYWVRTELVNRETGSLSFFVEIAYPVIDYISAFVVREKGVDEITMGDKYPFFKRPIEHRNFLFPLTLASGERVFLVLRVKTTSSMQIPLYIHGQRHFMEKDQTVVQGLGLYYGSMIIMILFNLFVYLSVRESSYLYYVIYVACMTLFLTSLNGTSYHYLWPDSIWWNDQVLVVSLNGVVFFGLLFTAGFLKVREARPKSFWVFVGFEILSALIVLFSYKIPYRIGIMSTIALAVFAIIWCMIMTMVRFFEGYASARFYALAWFTMLAGGVILALNKFGLIPRSSLTENATQYGSVLEVVLLSFALADRLNIEKKERIEAQNLAHLQERNARIANENALLNERKARDAREHAFEIQKKAKETLELKVEERTHELNETLVIVREANNQILSSLRYAGMIQQAMLPHPERIGEWFPRNFVWWRPRDIVGGDFYYIDVIEEGLIVAVADCTGHGVPGAFMTLIAGSELKRIVRGDGCADPGEILTRMNRRIRKTLKQDTGSAISDDGLDIGICVIRRNQSTVSFSGARINLVYTNDEGIHTASGDRHSVGYISSRPDYVYPCHRIPLTEDMTFYMFTDGITDQIGEKTGRRFGTRRLMETIRENCRLPMELQYERLRKTFDEYRGDREQMDDMTMIAFGGEG